MSNYCYNERAMASTSAAGGRCGMARQQQRLPADRVAHAVVAADDAGAGGVRGRGSVWQARSSVAKVRSPAWRRGGLVDHDADVALRPVGGVQLQHGVGVGQAGGLLGGQHQQRVGPGGHPAHRAVEAGAKVEQHRVVARGLAAQGGEHPLQRRRVEGGQRAGAGAAGDDVETAIGMVQRRVGQRGAAGDDAAQVLPRRQAELDVDIGEAEIGVEQQHAAALVAPARGPA